MYPLPPQVGFGADPSLPSEDRRSTRRGAPQALRFELPGPGWPPLLVTPLEPPRRRASSWGWLSALWRRPVPGAGPPTGPQAAPAR